MGCRTGLVGGALLFFFSIAGCSLPRGAIGGTAIDSGHSAQDSGPVGCLTSCDDHNPCTTDSCDSTGTCQHGNATGVCDDHVLCNGGDSCGAGTCSVHDGVSPCPGTSHCDTGSDTCMGCTSASDCPATTTSMWSACDFGTDLCTTSGMQMQTTTTYACTAGACVATASPTLQTCTRPSTDGTMCAAPSGGDWSACAFADPCTRAGMQSRTLTTSHCMAGTCQPVDMPESQACSRGSNDGVSCGTTTTTDWSTCMVGGTCATTGTQTQTSTTFTCASDACVMMVGAPVSRPCTVTSGGACGMTTCGAWSACAQTMPNTCNGAGTQTQTCTTPICGAGGAGGGGGCSDSAPTAVMQACTVDVTGTHAPCTSSFCGGCRVSGGGCPHGRTGTQTCQMATGTCTGSLLGTYCSTGLPMQTTQSCMCP